MIEVRSKSRLIRWKIALSEGQIAEFVERDQVDGVEEAGPGTAVADTVGGDGDGKMIFPKARMARKPPARRGSQRFAKKQQMQW